MDVKRENTSKQEVKLTITVSPEELKPFLEKAAKELSAQVDIPGFRKGHATLEAVQNHLSEMHVLEAAVDPVVQRYLNKAIDDEDLSVVGRPNVELEKAVPGNDFVFSATITLMPNIKKLGDYKKLSVDAQNTEPSKEDMERAIKDLARMQTKEVRCAKGTAVAEDGLVVVDLEMKKDGVVVEGGSGTDYRIFLNEDHYVPGMKKDLLGSKEGDKKTFTLTFPEEHYQKHLAGQHVEFHVDVKEVFKLEVPEVDDAFAKALGLESKAQLEEKIKENLQMENAQEEKARQEREMLELIANKTKFEDIPQMLIDDEVDKMFHELEHAVEKQGGVFADYLSSINKTPNEVREGMQEQALMRVKVALVLQEIGKQEQIAPTEQEVNEELQTQADFYKENDEARNRVLSPMYRAYTEHRMRNEKVIAHLRDSMVKPAKK